MKVKCEYCGSMIDDTCEKCPSCGATNTNLKRMVDTTPKTISELAKWYEDRKLPPYETTRFFIGIDYKKPRAFGIYEENGEFIVYKNKDDGSRAIRYRGTDEAYAVNELLLKLKSEILNQKARNVGSIKPLPSTRRAPRDADDKLLIISLWVIIASIVVSLITGYFRPIVFSLMIAGFIKAVLGIICDKLTRGRQGFLQTWPVRVGVFFALFITIATVFVRYDTPKYYKYDDTIYVNYHDDYFVYDNYWHEYSHVSSLPYEVRTYPSDYEYGWTDSTWVSVYDFRDSDIYESEYSPWNGSGSSSDSSYDWDSGSSWDSGGTDWGSDW